MNVGLHDGYSEGVMLLKYRVYQTSNALTGVPDPGRLDGLARRMITKESGNQNPDLVYVKQLAGTLAETYQKSRREDGGVCSGMVCSWAYNYLITDNPESPASLDDARLLQGQLEMTSFKRQAMDKESLRSVPRTKMYQSMGMSLTKVIKSQPFPPQTFRFGDATAQMIDVIGQEDNVPFLLSVCPKGGRHAIGMLYHAPTFYFLEPNEGLFKFPRKDLASQEINNHFIKELPPNSMWKLIAIGAS